MIKSLSGGKWSSILPRCSCLAVAIVLSGRGAGVWGLQKGLAGAVWSGNPLRSSCKYPKVLGRLTARERAATQTEGQARGLTSEG